MTNPIGNNGGNLNPLQMGNGVDSKDKATIADAEENVNALPEAGELKEGALQISVKAMDGGIPRPPAPVNADNAMQKAVDEDDPDLQISVLGIAAEAASDAGKSGDRRVRNVISNDEGLQSFEADLKTGDAAKVDFKRLSEGEISMSVEGNPEKDFTLQVKDPSEMSARLRNLISLSEKIGFINDILGKIEEAIARGWESGKPNI